MGTPTRFPADPEQLPVSYLLVTALIYAAGFGLVTSGHWARSRRRQRAGVPVA